VTEISADDPLYEAPEHTPRHKKPRQPLWTRVWESQLTNPVWRSFYPANRGRWPVRFTNAMAAEIGLDRAAKSRCLHQLEADGLIEIEQAGKSTPVVKLLQT
jgi:hypothetical protein